jgi:hypothetical protein
MQSILFGMQNRTPGPYSRWPTVDLFRVSAALRTLVSLRSRLTDGEQRRMEATLLPRRTAALLPKALTNRHFLPVPDADRRALITLIFADLSRLRQLSDGLFRKLTATVAAIADELSPASVCTTLCE